MTALWEQDFWPVVWVVAVAASAWAAWIDTRTHKIPNSLTGPLCLGGLLWSFWAGGLAGLGEAVLACIALALPFVVLFLFAGGGAGDAKMMGSLGAWLGLIGGGAALVAVVIAGGVLSIIFALSQRRFVPAMANIGSIAGAWIGVLRGYLRPRVAQSYVPSEKQMHPMPYGLAIATGVAIAAGGVVLWHIH